MAVPYSGGVPVDCADCTLPPDSEASMDLRKAYETLGVARGASTEEVEAAYERLRDDVDARLARVEAGPVRVRYREVRSRLDAAREAILSAPAPSPDEPLAHALEVLGLSPAASPLDVAAAYVSLCEEIDREVRDAPSDEIRRACLEARADVDAAYQRCALSPLHEAPELEAGEGGEPARAPVHYETQMASAPFEAPEAPEADVPVLRIEPERAGESRRSRRRRRRMRRLALAATLLLAVVGSGAAAVWWLEIDPRESLASLDLKSLEPYVPEVVLRSIAPLGPPPELLDAQSTAESLRRRLAEERVELQARVEETRARVEAVELTWSSAAESERERLAEELDRLRARRDLAVQHAGLAEEHVLNGDDLTVAYGRMEQAAELRAAEDPEAALAAFSEAVERLEAALGRLDLVEEAVGARSEAEAGLEAWRALAASAALEESAAATRGEQMLQSAREQLGEGRFEEAIPELRRASQQFATALAEGRKLAAASRANGASGATGPAETEGEEQAAAEPVDPEDRGDGVEEVAAEPPASPEPSVSPEPSTAAVVAAAPSVGAAPPSRARAAIKLVEVPEGDFLYGLPARRVSLSAFRIDRTEVRVNEYRSCVEAGVCSVPASGEGCNWPLSERGDHPVNCVSWSQARTYCGWLGKRLPSEREWEKAARGTDGRRYPWGDDDASCTRAVIAAAGAPGCGRDSTSPVASRAEGLSPFGLFDMAGNVLEWTADGAGDGTRVVRGGSWRSPAGPASAFARDRLEEETADASIGFRCAQSGGLYAVTP